MTPDDVAQSYDQLANRFHDGGVAPGYGISAHERALAFTERRGAALDLGCGSSGRIVDWLLTAGFEVEGLDVSPRMVELARSRHPQVRFHRADMCRWAFPRRYDFISAWDSLWHTPLAQQEALIARVLDALAPGGVFLFTTGGTPGPEEKEDAAMGPPMYHATPGLPAVLRAIDARACLCRHLEYDQYPELHVVVIAQRPVASEAVARR